MTKPRDPDIMALEHAIKALEKSTPRMKPHNVAFVVLHYQKELQHIGIVLKDERPPLVLRAI